jgi:hypothetical protein
MILQSSFNCFGIPSSNPSVCSGNGICTATDQCSCGDYYFGAQCQFAKCFGKDSTDQNVCSGNGNCTTLDFCECKKGYGGRECQEDYIKNDFPIAYSFGYSIVILLNVNKQAGERGDGNEINITLIPSKILENFGIKNIYSGAYQSAFMRNDSKIFVFGSNPVN